MNPTIELLPAGSPFEPAVATARRPAARRILIADDDAAVRAALAGVLESEGYLVLEAHNGIEAVTRALEHAPDLLLLDLNLPEWDGWTAFCQLERVAPLLPIIVITARPDQYAKAVRLGVDAFMEKPLDIPALLAAMAELLGETPDARVRHVTHPRLMTQWLPSPGGLALSHL